MARQTNPLTQTAYDRIQRAGTRSLMMVGNIGVVYELRKDGVCVRGVRSFGSGYCREYNKLVSWTVLARAEVDPLMEAHETVLAELSKLQEVVNGVGG